MAKNNSILLSVILLDICGLLLIIISCHCPKSSNEDCLKPPKIIAFDASIILYSKTIMSLPKTDEKFFKDQKYVGLIRPQYTI